MLLCTDVLLLPRVHDVTLLQNLHGECFSLLVLQLHLHEDNICSRARKINYYKIFAMSHHSTTGNVQRVVLLFLFFSLCAMSENDQLNTYLLSLHMVLFWFLLLVECGLLF